METYRRHRRHGMPAGFGIPTARSRIAQRGADASPGATRYEGHRGGVRGQPRSVRPGSRFQCTHFCRNAVCDARRHHRSCARRLVHCGETKIFSHPWASRLPAARPWLGVGGEARGCVTADSLWAELKRRADQPLSRKQFQTVAKRHRQLLRRRPRLRLAGHRRVPGCTWHQCGEALHCCTRCRSRPHPVDHRWHKGFAPCAGWRAHCCYRPWRRGVHCASRVSERQRRCTR